MAKEFTPTNITNPVYPLNIWQKADMFDTEKNADVFLGELDTLFLIAYAIGLFVSGIVGDRINLRYLLSFGMCGSAIMTFLFGYVSAVFDIQNKFYYRCTYFLNGLLQSTGWPATVAVMGNWFSKSSGGLIFGFWSANASVGNIFGSLLVATVLSYGYEYGILVNSILLFCGGIMMFICLIPHPNDVGLPSPVEADDNHPQKHTCTSGEASSDAALSDQEQPEIIKIKENKAIGFFEALLIPGVIPYSLAYACLKLVNYTFFFWLPVYLSQGLHWNDALSDKLSNFYDGGSILGGIIAGVITDLMGIRSPIVVIMLALSTGCLYIYSAFGTSYTANVLLMFLVGFMLGGPANTISTAITADLGKHEKIRGSADALATVTGIVDGTGSIGAAIGQYVVPIINKHSSWHMVFYFLMIMAGISMLCVIPMLVNEVLNRVRTRKYALLEK